MKLRQENRDKIYSFRSAGLTQFSVETQKICLSSNDDKRYTLNDKITTLALEDLKNISN